jgi:hypothetical protein
MKKRTTICIDKELLEMAKKYGINLSRFVEYCLKNYIESKWGEIFEKEKEKEDILVVLVKCPQRHENVVVLIDKNGNFKKDTRTYCKICGSRFRISKRILSILKGDINLYWKWYYFVHKNKRVEI